MAAQHAEWFGDRVHSSEKLSVQRYIRHWWCVQKIELPTSQKRLNKSRLFPYCQNPSPIQSAIFLLFKSYVIYNPTLIPLLSLQDRNNVFYVIIEFLIYMKTNNAGLLEGVNLGRSGINLLRVIEEQQMQI